MKTTLLVVGASLALFGCAQTASQGTSAQTVPSSDAVFSAPPTGEGSSSSWSCADNPACK
jgi:hypothetical protein